MNPDGNITEELFRWHRVAAAGNSRAGGVNSGLWAVQRGTELICLSHTTEVILLLPSFLKRMTHCVLVSSGLSFTSSLRPPPIPPPRSSVTRVFVCFTKTPLKLRSSRQLCVALKLRPKTAVLHHLSWPCIRAQRLRCSPNLQDRRGARTAQAGRIGP